MDEPDLQALACAAAALLALPIAPDMLDGVAANLALLRRHAAQVAGLDLADDEEIASVFCP